MCFLHFTAYLLCNDRERVGFLDSAAHALLLAACGQQHDLHLLLLLSLPLPLLHIGMMLKPLTRHCEHPARPQHTTAQQLER